MPHSGLIMEAVHFQARGKPSCYRGGGGISQVTRASVEFAHQFAGRAMDVRSGSFLVEKLLFP